MTLTYDYGRSLVWLDPLSPEREPHAYDLCAHHAEHLTVPLGWHVHDHVRSATGSLGSRLSA